MGPSLSWGYSFGKAWGVSFGRGESPLSGGGSSKKRRGWARERAIFEASQQPAVKVIQEIKKAVIQPKVSYSAELKYSAELEKLDTLKQEFDKLQIAYNIQQDQAKDLQEASIVLSEVLSDEEDTIGVLLATQQFEAQQMLIALGITATTQPILGEIER